MVNCFKKIFTVIALVCFSICSAEIIEIKNMHEIYPYITQETLVVFDIDNTLMEPVQSLGNDQWFYHQLHRCIANGMDTQEALKQTIHQWHAMQMLTKVQIVEPGSAEIVKDLQNKGYTTMGLTTRGLDVSNCTEDQLNTIGIDLTCTAPVKYNVFFQNPQKGVLFHAGILFTMNTHKGHAFFKFLDAINYSPKHVVFINDKASHIKEIEMMCHEKQIPFIGLRYGYLDEKVRNYNPKIGDVQFSQFGKFLSDEEARRLLE